MGKDGIFGLADQAPAEHETDRLTSRVDAAVREIERMTAERQADRGRAARARLAAVHVAKRFQKQLTTGERQAPARA